MNQGKEINRRTFQDVVGGELQALHADIQRELQGKLARAELFRKTNSAKARDYDMQADGLIDAAMMVQARIDAVKKGGKL